MTELIKVTDPTACAVQRWRVGRDAQVTKSSVLCLVLRSDGTTQKVTAPVSGRLAKIVKQNGELLSVGDTLAELSTSCDHEVVMKDICALCGANLREELGRPGQRILPSAASIPMVHCIPELHVSENRAQNLAQMDIERLLKERRLALLVDLDQTIIHTTMDAVPPNLSNVARFRLSGDRNPAGYTTKLRPGCEEFLNALMDKFELHIVTFGNRLYAHKIAEVVDPKKKYFSHRILSRDEAFNPLTKTGNLKALFPRGDQFVCIIDDRDEVWECVPNLIHVKQYSYFVGTEDINSPHKNKKVSDSVDPMDEAADQAKKRLEHLEEEERRQLEQKAEHVEEKEEASPSKTKDENSNSKSTDGNSTLEWPDHDNYLPRLQKILFDIHEEFYSKVDLDTPFDLEKLPSLKSVVPKVKSRVLSGCAIVFSGVFPQQMPLEKSKAYYIATGLGAEVQNAIVVPENKKRKKYRSSKSKKRKKENSSSSSSSDEDVDVENVSQGQTERMTTHLVAAKSNTSKWHAAKKAGIHVVTPDWLWACHFEWERLPEDDFELGKVVGGEAVEEAAHSRKRRLLEERQYARLNRQKKKEAEEQREQVKTATPAAEDEDEKVAKEVAASLPSPPRFDLADNPLLRMSRTDLEDMEEEVMAAAGDSDDSSSSSSEDSDDQRELQLRQAVLGKTATGSRSPSDHSVSARSESNSQGAVACALNEGSQEAASPWTGEYPEGWEPKSKKEAVDKGGEDDRDWGEGYAQEGYDYGDAERRFKALSDSATSSEDSGDAELSEEGDDTLDALREFM